MAYKSVLLHVEPTDAGRQRLRTAIDIARMFEARLIAVGARALNAIPDPIGLSVVKLREEVEEELKTAEALFKQETAALAPSTRQWHAQIASPTDALLRHASEADIIVADRNLGGSAPETQAATADLIMSSGLPVLALPTGARFDAKRIVIAWKDTREARRAVWDALPLLKRAESVRVFSFGADAGPKSVDIVARLRLHGVRVDAEAGNKTKSSVPDDLLAAAHAHQAGLIVLGAYGHSRLREWALGGVTQGLLAHADLPLFFSH